MSDTGPGVPAKAREHLFEAFQTSGRPGGSGLGLAIAAELIRAHGGDIHLVEGTIGATFRISIPDRPVELQSVRNERARRALQIARSGRASRLSNHCSLTPPALPTCAHFAISAFTWAENASPVLPTVVAP